MITSHDIDLNPNSFAEALREFLREFAAARAQPFQKIDSLWAAIGTLKSRLERFAAIKIRPNLDVNISVGLGNWATTPWIAILNAKVTQSTQEGVYVVFLVATDLKRVFLTLNQGTTALVKGLGQSNAPSANGGRGQEGQNIAH